jgi:hypothetical protein
VNVSRTTTTVAAVTARVRGLLPVAARHPRETNTNAEIAMDPSAGNVGMLLTAETVEVALLLPDEAAPLLGRI